MTVYRHTVNVTPHSVRIQHVVVPIKRLFTYISILRVFNLRFNFKSTVQKVNQSQRTEESPLTCLILKQIIFSTVITAGLTCY